MQIKSYIEFAYYILTDQTRLLTGYSSQDRIWQDLRIKLRENVQWIYFVLVTDCVKKIDKLDLSQPSLSGCFYHWILSRAFQYDIWCNAVARRTMACLAFFAFLDGCLRYLSLAVAFSTINRGDDQKFCLSAQHPSAFFRIFPTL